MPAGASADNQKQSYGKCSRIRIRHNADSIMCLDHAKRDIRYDYNQILSDMRI